MQTFDWFSSFTKGCGNGWENHGTHGLQHYTVVVHDYCKPQGSLVWQGLRFQYV